MNLYKIVLPQQHNDGSDALRAHLVFQGFVAALVGGFTRGRISYGAWKSPEGEIIQENVIPYEIACEPDKFTQIVAKASELFADQSALFYAEIGTATIVELQQNLVA